MTEIELKLLLAESDEKRLQAHAGLKRMSRGRARTETLRTIYHDTHDWRLRDEGIAFRLRQSGGGWLQSVKLGRAMTGGLSRTREVETPVRDGTIDLDAIPDAALRDRIRAALGDGTLGPVAETRIRRTTRTLDHAGSLIELSLDRGEVVAGDRSAPLGEAEFELVEGDPNALFDAAAELFDDGLVRFSERSKADRAHLLATEGRIADPPAPRKARAVALDREMTTAEAAQAVLGACFEQVSANAEAVIATENSEAVHQLRVGLRRLRTALRILPKEHQPARMVALLDEAKRIGQAAGPVRDLDVMREDVLGPAAEAEPLPGWASLVRALDARAGPSREALRGALSDARTQRFLIDLAAISAAGPRKRPSEDLTAEQMRRPAIETVRDALRRAWKRVKKRAKGIEELDPEGRHELRKALKRLRYTVEFSAALYPADAVKPFVKRLRRLQNVFGELNDLAMAERVLAGDEPPARTVPEARYAAGLLIGGARRRSEERWGEAKAAWKTLKKAGPYW